MSASLIVPSRYAVGKPGRRKISNPFASMRRHATRVWKDEGKRPLNVHPGRKYGATVGGWISDLTELRKAIVLCWRCQSKFYYKRAKYYRDEVFPYATGTCDGCRQIAVQGKLYIPEERLSDPGSLVKPGQCWTPR